MRVSEEPVGIYLFRQNQVLITLQLRSIVHGSRLRGCGHEQLISNGGRFKQDFAERDGKDYQGYNARSPITGLETGFVPA
jgi:hypothetical protein